jgi:hypothetical protein
MNLAEQIKSQANVLNKETIEFFGITCFVQAWRAWERDQWDAQQHKLNEQGGIVSAVANIRARLIVACLVDESGQKIFNANDADTIANMNAVEVDRVFNICRRVVGLIDQTEADESKKNS